MSVARRAAAVAVLGALTLTACSNSEAPIARTKNSGSASASVVAGKQTITIDVGDDYRFHPSTIYVHPGLLTVVLRHTGTKAPHNFAVTGFPGDFVAVNAGQTHSVTFQTPSPGTYQFECTIHAQLGQTGKMIVLKQ